jgi:hypothetical protein
MASENDKVDLERGHQLQDLESTPDVSSSDTIAL